MNNDKILRILKIVLLISMLLFVITYSKYKTNDCQLCSFEVKEDIIRLDDFLEVYSEECFGNDLVFNQPS